MNAAIPEADGPLCDLCQAEPAVASLMNLADWSRVKLGVNCASGFLRSVADSMDGGTSGQVLDEDPVTGDMVPVGNGTGAATAPCPLCEAPVTDDGMPEHAGQHLARQSEPHEYVPHHQLPVCAQCGAERDAHIAPGDGSASDHWAQTRNVRKSTHGHRGGGRKGTSDPEAGAP